MLFKAKNLEQLENFKRYFNLKYEIIYFYNVYGPIKFEGIHVDNV